MSDAVSWGKLPQIVDTGGEAYTNAAMLTIRMCVSIMQMRGNTIKNSYSDLSCRLKITSRRVRALLEDDGMPVVKQTEWDTLRKRAGCFFLEEAARLRERAKAYETVANKMISDGDVLTPSELALIGDKRRAATDPIANSLCV